MASAKRLVFVAFCMAPVAFIAFAGCESATSKDPWASAGAKPKILVSFPPLYSFAKSVAGDDAEVKCLMTSEGAHFHGDATPAKIKLAARCDVFIVNGLLLDDDLAAKLRAPAANSRWNVLNLGSRLDAKVLRVGACKHDHDAKDDDHDHGVDPHVWLGIRHAKVMTEAIRDTESLTL